MQSAPSTRVDRSPGRDYISMMDGFRVGKYEFFGISVAI